MYVLQRLKSELINKEKCPPSSALALLFICCDSSVGTYNSGEAYSCELPEFYIVIKNLNALLQTESFYR